MSPYYIKTSICGSSQWKEVSGFYVKKNGEWCEVNEAYIKTSICVDSRWKQYYSRTNIQPGTVIWTIDTTPASGTVIANGSSINATSQPTLHALLTDPNNLNSSGNPPHSAPPRSSASLHRSVGPRSVGANPSASLRLCGNPFSPLRR